jgi:hypothetical protein
MLNNNMLNVRTCEIQVRERLNGLERAWITGRLLAKRGVLDVDYREDASRQIVVEYDADVLTGAELVSFLHACGLPAKPATHLRVV